MIRAGSLTYAIFLAVVSAILCSMMILLAYTNRSYFVQMDAQDVTRDNAYSGVAMAMASGNMEDFEKWVDLYGDLSDSVLIKKRRWGCYHVITSRAKKAKSFYAKTAVVGCGSKLVEETALWLADLNRPLQLTGDALLKGVCYLPERGVDRAYVEGKNYSRQQMVYGKSKASSQRIPSPDKHLKEYWFRYLESSYSSQDSVIDFESLSQETLQAFNDKTLIVRSEDRMDLSGYRVTGNVILISTQKITVPVSAQLHDVVLIAPEIVVGEKTSLQAHLVAKDTVKLGEGVTMSYPSSIMMAGGSYRDPYLKMGEDVEFTGSVFSFSADQRRTNDLAVEIASTAVLKGVLYCEGNLELNGQVRGTVICNKFLLATPSGIYENHLLDGKIDRSGLPAEFASVRLEGEENYSKLASWVSY